MKIGHFVSSATLAVYDAAHKTDYASRYQHGEYAMNLKPALSLDALEEAEQMLRVDGKTDAISHAWLLND